MSMGRALAGLWKVKAMRLGAPALVVIIVVILGSIPLTVGAPSRVLSQGRMPSLASPTSGTPTAENLGVRLGLPTGVTVLSLGSSAVDLQDTAMDFEALIALELERITLAPDTAVLKVYGTFLHVEAGRVMIVTDTGLESRPYEAGSQIPLRADVYYGVRNVADEPAVLLRVDASTGEMEAAAMEAAATPDIGGISRTREVTTYQAVPMRFVPPGPEPTPIPGVDTEVLMYEEAVMPPEPAVVFLIRTTWPTGIELGDSLVTGLVVLHVESGELTALDPYTGLEVKLSTDQGLVYGPQEVVRLRAEGTQSAQMLILGLAPRDQPLVVPTE